MFPKNGLIGSVYLHVENISSDPAKIAPVTYITIGGEERQGSDIMISPGEVKWVEAKFGIQNSARVAIFNLPQSNLWITGISVNSTARPGVFWPWDESATVRWHVRGTPSNSIYAFAFDFPHLLDHWRTTVPRSLPMRRVISDSSGIVFIEMAYPQSQ